MVASTSRPVHKRRIRRRCGRGSDRRVCARITLLLDGLSLVMIGVITGVGFLIHLYATGYMAGETVTAVFAYMNLFVFAMLILVLGDNLLVLYFGWEGVGLLAATC
jgi:NADH:ubiquinone oxidoreductase subunit 5 (subunit L)/multisubunit Na+/H+ antiporter MnhA subunit